jgi:hypothetical protein
MFTISKMIKLIMYSFDYFFCLFFFFFLVFFLTDVGIMARAHYGFDMFVIVVLTWFQISIHTIKKHNTNFNDKLERKKKPNFHCLQEKMQIHFKVSTSLSPIGLIQKFWFNVFIIYFSHLNLISLIDWWYMIA